MIDLGNGVQLITRAEWGATPPTSSTPVQAEQGVLAHWEGPHMGTFPHSQCASKVRSIQAYHKGKGWSDIAYSAVPCPHGFVYEGRGPNIRTAANGTNICNDAWLAICYLSGEGDPFTDAGKRAMRAAADWLDRAGAGPGRGCHRDCKSTQCPGDVICQWVRAGLPVTGGTTPPTTGDWLDMATKAEVQEAIEDGTRKVLNEGTGEGLTTWRDTNKELLDVARAVYNQTNRPDLAAGVDEAFTTSGSGTRQQFAGDADGDIQSLVDLALKRSPTFTALAAQVQAIAEAVGAAPTRQVPTA